MNKEQVVEELEKLCNSDPSLQMGLSHMIAPLRAGAPGAYRAAALSLGQLADNFEKAGLADAATIGKLREIVTGLEAL